MQTKIQTKKGHEIIVLVEKPSSDSSLFDGQVSVTRKEIRDKDDNGELNLGQLIFAGFYVVEDNTPVLSVFLTEHEAKKYASKQPRAELHKPLLEQINLDLRKSLSLLASIHLEDLLYIKKMCGEPVTT